MITKMKKIANVIGRGKIISVNQFDNDIFLLGLTNNVKMMNINGSGFIINNVSSEINNNQLSGLSENSLMNKILERGQQ